MTQLTPEESEAADRIERAVGKYFEVGDHVLYLDQPAIVVRTCKPPDVYRIAYTDKAQAVDDFPVNVRSLVFVRAASTPQHAPPPNDPPTAGENLVRFAYGKPKPLIESQSIADLKEREEP